MAITRISRTRMSPQEIKRIQAGMRAGRRTGGGMDLSAITRASERARQANLKRYRQGLSTLKAGYRKATRQAKQFGISALQDVEESAVQQRATGEQDLISRGLGGTTIRGAMTRGVERERLRGRARIGEQRAMLLGQIAQQRATAVSGFMERRADVGPDMGMFASLIQSAQQGGGAGGGTTVRRMGGMASRGLDIFGRPMGSKFGRGGPSITRPRSRGGVFRKSPQGGLTQIG